MQLNHIHHADALELLPTFTAESVHLVVADPPYFPVLKESWDNQWSDEAAYLGLSMIWLREAMRVFVSVGLHFCSALQEAGTRFVAFDERGDAGVRDRVVGYNTRRDSFAPVREQILVLKKKRFSSVRQRCGSGSV